MYQRAKCIICGKEFDQHTRRHLTCSDECRHEYNKDRRRRYYWQGEPPDIKTARECPVCGTLFHARRNGKTYCSQACKDKRARLKRIQPRTCAICGKTFVSIRPRLCCSQECEKIRTKEKEKKRRETMPAIIETEDMVIRTCVMCGVQFFDVETSTRKTCSHDCSVEYEKAQTKVRKDKRLNKGNIVDTNITLKQLFNRDGGRCWLCGERCKWSDKKTRKNGIIPGPTYPSIDHVIPLARGGLHAWDNVRLAHLECNMRKNDSVIEEGEGLPPKISIPAGSKRRKKKTAQRSKDGELLQVFESTRVAADQTGIGEKRIQDCARGRQHTAGGFKWSYID